MFQSISEVTLIYHSIQIYHFSISLYLSFNKTSLEFSSIIPLKISISVKNSILKFSLVISFWEILYTTSIGNSINKISLVIHSVLICNYAESIWLSIHPFPVVLILFCLQNALSVCEFVFGNRSLEIRILFELY